MLIESFILATIKATDWQAQHNGVHLHRREKHNLTIESSKNEAGERTYLIAR